MIFEVMDIYCDSLLMFLHQWFKAVQFHSILRDFNVWCFVACDSASPGSRGQVILKKTVQTEISFYSCLFFVFFKKKKSKAAKDCMIHFWAKGGFSVFWLTSAAEEENKFYSYCCYLCYLCLPCEETVPFSLLPKHIF